MASFEIRMGCADEILSAEQTRETTEPPVIIGSSRDLCADFLLKSRLLHPLLQIRGRLRAGRRSRAPRLQAGAHPGVCCCASHSRPMCFLHEAHYLRCLRFWASHGAEWRKQGVHLLRIPLHFFFLRQVSSGFDAGAMDPLSHQMLTSASFGQFAKEMKQVWRRRKYFLTPLCVTPHCINGAAERSTSSVCCLTAAVTFNLVAATPLIGHRARTHVSGCRGVRWRQDCLLPRGRI